MYLFCVVIRVSLVLVTGETYISEQFTGYHGGTHLQHRRLKQELCEFVHNFIYTVKPCLKATRSGDVA